jgi:hypothetical protein
MIYKIKAAANVCVAARPTAAEPDSFNLAKFADVTTRVLGIVIVLRVYNKDILPPVPELLDKVGANGPPPTSD